MIGNAKGFAYEIVVAGFRDHAFYYPHLRLTRKTTALPDLSLFDTPSFYDRPQQAREFVPRQYMPVSGNVTLTSNVLIFLTLLGILARLSPLASLVAFVTATITYFAQLRIAWSAWHVYKGQAPGP